MIISLQILTLTNKGKRSIKEEWIIVQKFVYMIYHQPRTHCFHGLQSPQINKGWHFQLQSEYLHREFKHKMKSKKILPKLSKGLKDSARHKLS